MYPCAGKDFKYQLGRPFSGCGKCPGREYTLTLLQKHLITISVPELLCYLADTKSMMQAIIENLSSN